VKKKKKKEAGFTKHKKGEKWKVHNLQNSNNNKKKLRKGEERGKQNRRVTSQKKGESTNCSKNEPWGVEEKKE